MKSIKKWVVILLVFWGMWKILIFLLRDVLFEVLTFPDPYANILQTASDKQIRQERRPIA